MTGWTPCGIDFEPTPCPTYSGSGIPTHARAGELLSDLSGASTPEEKNAVPRELMPVLLELDTTQAVIRGALKTAGTETAIRVLAAASYSWGLADSVFAVLDTMSLTDLEDSVFHSSYSVLASALDDDRGILELSSEETDSLLVLAEYETPSASISQAVIEALELSNYYSMIEQWSSEKRGAEKPTTDPVHALVVYPVPFSKSITVEYALDEDEVGLLIVADLAGREIMRFELSCMEATKQVSMADIPSGFYVATLTTSQGLVGAAKLIKQ